MRIRYRARQYPPISSNNAPRCAPRDRAWCFQRSRGERVIAAARYAVQGILGRHAHSERARRGKTLARGAARIGFAASAWCAIFYGFALELAARAKKKLFAPKFHPIASNHNIAHAMAINTPLNIPAPFSHETSETLSPTASDIIVGAPPRLANQTSILTPIAPPVPPRIYAPSAGIRLRQVLQATLPPSTAPENKLTSIKQLDQGAQGIVFLIQDENGSHFVAKAKKNNSKLLKNNNQDESYFFNSLGNFHAGWPKTYGNQYINISNTDAKPVKALIMEYINGRNLENYIPALQNSKLSESEKTDIVRYLAIAVHDALKYSASKKIEHRDIKPWNIMIEKNTGRVVVLDLGVAKIHSLPPTNGIYSNDEKALESIIASLLPPAESAEPESFMGMQPMQPFSMRSFDASTAPVISASDCSLEKGSGSTLLTNKFLDEKSLNKDKTISNVLSLMLPKI